MRVLIALMLLLCCSGVARPSKHGLIVLANDGALYRLDPRTRQVDWHNELPFRLLSFDLAPEQHPPNHTGKYFIPTLEGDFLYLERGLATRPKQILVPREDVQHLLDVCFDSKPQQKYFFYQKLEYFVLNTGNGQLAPLEDYFAEKQVFNRSLHAIMIVSRKLLKQLNHKMEVKWSVISSKVEMATLDDFVKASRAPHRSVEHPVYSFVRLDPRTIQILDSNRDVVFEIEGPSPILSIFYADEGQYRRVAIKAAQLKMLALSDSGSQRRQEEVSSEIAKVLTASEQKFDHFPESRYFQSNHEQAQQSLDNLQICIRTHNILKQHGYPKKGGVLPGISQGSIDGGFSEDTSEQLYQDLDLQNLPTLPYSGDKRIKVIVTKQQPFVYLFLMVSIVVGGLLFYRFKVNKIWEKITLEKSITDENLKKFAAKLGEYENVGKELRKMYDVNWDSLLQKNDQYFVFEGRFLNQNTEVYVVALENCDVVDMEHKLNILINCSHKSIAKLYYYTKNEDSLLIFSEAIKQRKLSSFTQDDEIFDKFLSDEQSYKKCIRTLLDSLCQVTQLKMELNSISEQSITISDTLDVKINTIPSFLAKPNEEEDRKLMEMGTSRLRVDLVSIIHRLKHKGSHFSLTDFEQEKHKKENDGSFLADFYEYILLRRENEEEIEGIRNAEKHPYLWDSKQKMLYLCDFSNYVETCIDEHKIHKMEQHCRNHQVIGLPWVRELHPAFVNEINNFRKYDYHSVRDLIRLIRNKLSHFHEIPKDTRRHVGKTPELFVEYILEKYPRLLPFMYVYANKKQWKLSAAN